MRVNENKWEEDRETTSLKNNHKKNQEDLYENSSHKKSLIFSEIFFVPYGVVEQFY